MIVDLRASRQAIADAPLRGRRPSFRTWAEYHLRKIAYLSKSTRRLAANFSSAAPSAQFWDSFMSSETGSTYLSHTIELDWRNVAVSTLIRYYATPNPAVLDVGCAAGTLALTLPPFSKYQGVDISDVAISEARRSPSLARPDISLAVAGMSDFKIDGTWDVIIFNEVLYYPSFDEAVDQVARYAAALRLGGIICVSMKDMAKSHAIFDELTKRYSWRGGMLWQRKPLKPDYRARINRECPAYLIAALAPN